MREKLINKIINTKEEALIVIIAVVLFLGSAGYVVAQSTGKSDTFYVKSNGANIRSCKSTSCKVIGRLNRNATITMQTRSTLRGLPQWIKITFTSKGRKYTGYLNKTVLAMLAIQPTIVQGTTPDTYTPYTPPTTRAQTPLSSVFYEDFSGVFPGSKWVYERDSGYNSSLPQIDSNIGNPAPSLAMPFPGSKERGSINMSGTKIITEVNPFNSTNGFSISADIRQPDTSFETTGNQFAGTWIRSFRFDIKNITNQYAYANLEIDPLAEKIKYGIYREYTGGGGSFVTAPYMPDANFHTFKFTVDADGNAKWFRDGIMKNSFDGFPVGDYLVSMVASGRPLPINSTSTASYFHNVDNVVVTIP
jgi:hypothetical protein